jgi:hypothetical protein
MTAKFRSLVIWPMLIASLMLFISGCTSGGGTDPIDDPGNSAPSIFGLSRNAANPGDSVKIFGNNFGADLNGGQVTLNGLDFGINAWSENEIDVTVPAGATSGILVVRKNQLASQNGQEAQLFIGSAPNVDPTLFALTPGYGRRGTDEITITGQGFGSFSESNGVFFTADPDAGTEFVKADIVTNEATGTPIWTASAIRVRVPQNAITGPASVYVEVNGVQSNEKPFTVQPPVLEGDVIITNVDPPQGPIGATVTITGNNFGNQQGGSTLTINDKSLTILDWTNTQITAQIPEGATTGAIRATVAGSVYDYVPNFVVGNAPIITGLSPTEIRIGQSMRVFGNFFGFTQDGGTLTIGSQEIGVTSWNDDEIFVETLPSLTNLDSTEDIPVQVTSGNGLQSNVILVDLVSDLQGVVGVSPRIGVAGKTTFTFTTSVAGGSGNYSFKLFPESPASTSVPGGAAIAHQYPTKGTYQTRVEVKDTATGDTIIVQGPSVTVVGPDELVITEIETVDFGQADVSENPWSTTVLPPTFTEFSYNDFVFFNDEIYFTSSMSDLFVGSSKLTAYERDQAGFLAGSTTPKPYAYRRKGADGSVVRLHGFNFGTTKGDVFLNSAGAGGGTQVPDSLVTVWGEEGDNQDEIIEFQIPADIDAHLSGLVKVVRADAVTVTSIDPLIVSALILEPVAPGEVPLDGELFISGFDFQAPVITGVTGNQTFMFWVVNATYDDPFVAGVDSTTNEVLMVNPVPVTPTSPQLIQFDMSTLGAVVNVEVPDPTLSSYQVVPATLVEGDYQFFLWTGALLTGTNQARAVSGVFSEPVDVAIGAGGGGGNPPDANIVATPDSGTAPLDVELDASTSTDNGTITKYEFKFGDGGAGEPWTDNGNNPVINHTYTANGTYNAQVRVTDDEAETGVASVSIVVGGGGGGTGIIRGTTELQTSPAAPPNPPDTDPLPNITLELRLRSDDTLLDTTVSDGSGEWEFTGVDMDISVYITPTTAPAGSWFPPDIDKPGTFWTSPSEGNRFIDTNGF